MTLWLCLSASATSQPVDQIDELLRNRIEAATVEGQLQVGEEKIYASAMLPLFYERRAYAPAWGGANGDRSIRTLVAALLEAGKEGLRANDYHTKKLEKILELSSYRSNPRGVVDLELLATDAFLVYGSHLLSGIVNPESIDPEWFANRRGADLAFILENALGSGDVGESLAALLPPQPGYRRLRDALARYRALQNRGGWPGIEEGEKLEPGTSGNRVRALRQRLIATGDMLRSHADPDSLYDESTEAAVRKFQSRHGLKRDGVVGKSTLQALNVPVDQRIRQIVINMERWRWLPQDLGDRHIIVNIANFELDVFEKGSIVLSMRVVVGRDYRRTPVFTDKMTYLVLNPSWNVPPSLAVKDKLPEIRKDPNYLARQKMHLLSGWGEQTVEIDPTTVDWSKVTAKNFPYRIKQDPGPLNALGRIKFMFPNKFNVYLHDTPSRDLFGEEVRAFSSGCIRLQEPIELAEYVLKVDKRWTRDKILAELTRGKEQTVRLPESIPVHILYWTAWANDDGTIRFRDDIYGRDKLLYDAMREKPPDPSHEGS